MGKDIEITDFTSADYKIFSKRLYDCLSTLKPPCQQRVLAKVP